MRCDALCHERDERLRLAVCYDAETETTGNHVALATFVLARPDFDGAHHDRHVVIASAFAARLAADVRLVNLNSPSPANAILVRSNHRRAELVEHLERCLVSGQPKLPLDLNGTHAGRVARHEI